MNTRYFIGVLCAYRSVPQSTSFAIWAMPCSFTQNALYMKKKYVLPRVNATANKRHLMQDGLVQNVVPNYSKPKTGGDS